MENVLIDVYNSKKEKKRMNFNEVLRLEMGRLDVKKMEFEVIKALVILKRSELIKKIRNLPYYSSIDKEIVIDENFKLDMEEEKLIDSALSATRGIIAVNSGKAVDLYTTSCCGGGTANSEDVIGYRINYLRKILCRLCDSRQSENVIRVEDIAEKLHIVPPSAKKEIKELLTDVVRDETGRIINICVMGQTITGDEFSNLVGGKSSRIYFQENSIKVKSFGEGSGLGICLNGANTLAGNGFNYKDIIGYYYTDITFIELDEKNANSSLHGKRIVVDPGHGGNDNGNSIGPILEKNVNLFISLELERRLKEKGVDVILTRSADINVPLASRVSLINEFRPEIFISIHQNNIMFKGVNGVEVYCYDKDIDARKLGECIEYYVSQDLEIKNRGIKTGDYHLLRETKVSGIILECMYMSGDSDSLKYTADNYNMLSDSIFKGICKFYNIEQ